MDVSRHAVHRSLERPPRPSTDRSNVRRGPERARSELTMRGPAEQPSGGASTPHPAQDDALAAVRSAITLGASLIGTWSVALLVRVLLPRWLGPSTFGALNFAESFTASLFILLGLGVETYIQRGDPHPARACLGLLRRCRGRACRDGRRAPRRDGGRARSDAPFARDPAAGPGLRGRAASAGDQCQPRGPASSSARYAGPGRHQRGRQGRVGAPASCWRS